MLNISEISIDKAEVTIPFLNIPEATITVAKISNEELMDIREQCVVGKYLNPKTKVLEEKLDNEKFLRLYADCVIVRWKGLLGKHLSRLMLVNLPKGAQEQVVESTPENKYQLISKSDTFDSFITQVLEDVNLFNKQISEHNEGKLSASSAQ